jgi:DNA-binding NarL/FixJ family response regulator
MRARISIAMGRSRDAADICKSVADGRDVPSTLAEVDGLLAVSLAACGVRDEAEEAIEQAERASRACEIRALTAAARSICAARARNDGAEEVFEFARDAGIVDAIVTAVRASRDLLAYAAQQPPLASQLADLFRRSRDYGLARRAGIHLTPTADPNDVLSAREMEVLGLIAQGLRNRDISEALYITESTTKIHVRHIFDKLGVRSRAEAAARYNELSP